jgi:hypothetical protein
MNKAVSQNFKVNSEEKELLKKHLCRSCEMKLDNLEIKDLVSVMHQFCQELDDYKDRYSGGNFDRVTEEEWEEAARENGETALKAQIKSLRHTEVEGKDYVECMNRAQLYSYPWYSGVIGGNSHAVSELYPLGNGCKEWLKV